ncbi:MAG: CHC2 zinc finger domain-containing protein [Candidatus Omnitrophota bacterium]
MLTTRERLLKSKSRERRVYTTLREIMESDGIKLTGLGVEKKGLCPFHKDTNPSMYVNIEKDMFFCHVCGAGGGKLKYVQLRDNVSCEEAKDKLGYTKLSFSDREFYKLLHEAKEELRKSEIFDAINCLKNYDTLTKEEKLVKCLINVFRWKGKDVSKNLSLIIGVLRGEILEDKSDNKITFS